MATKFPQFTSSASPLATEYAVGYATDVSGGERRWLWSDVRTLMQANLGALATVTPGTGVATALAVNVGTAGAFITFNGNAGTPSALVGTNITGTAAGLTAGTASAVALGGITGLGSGVATALAIAANSAGGFLTNAGAVTSITGTANQITASAATGAVTLSLPTAIAGVNSLTSATGQALTLTTLDSNANINLTPHGTGNVVITQATRPMLIFTKTGTTALGRLFAAVANNLDQSQNLSFDGTNWNLDDTSRGGTVLVQSGAVSGSGFGFNACDPASNPVTLTQLGTWILAGLTVNATAEATTGAAGSIKTLGGIYATKAIVTGSTTDATTTSTGSVITAGGVGIAKALWVGGLTNIAGALTVTGHVTLEGVTSTGATGTGKLVFDGSPTLTTAVLGSSTATSQSVRDNSTKLATTAYADRAALVGNAAVALSGTTSTTIDCSLGNNFTLTLGGNLGTITLSNFTDGQIINAAFTNTASNYTVTWGNSIKWAGGSQPVQTIGAKTDVWTIVKLGSTLYGSVVQNMS